MPKDPKRWQEVIISSPFGNLTKQDVYDYYQRPDIKNKLLSLLKATESKETILRQSFQPGHTVLRRKDHQGNLIDLRKAKDFNDWAKLRMTEVHPVFGRKTNQMVADIDPGAKVPWDTVKALTETVARTMEGAEGVKSVDIQFSGDRGFYVRGNLGVEQNTNDVRAQLKKLVQGIAQRPDVTLKKPGAEEVRIDLSPMKNRGSVKAPFSLSAVTGLVAAPVELSKLKGVQRTDFKIENVKTSAKKEFAPGIPSKKKMKPIPEIKKPEPTWMMAIQEHDAKKSGKHYDLRLVQPLTNDAHSWAIPKARLPEKEDRMLLAIQQPTHTRDYALHFTGTLPKGYGEGTVTMPIKEEVKMIYAGPKKLKFERSNGDQFVMFKTKGNNWGIKKKANWDKKKKEKEDKKKKGTAFIRMKMR